MGPGNHIVKRLISSVAALVLLSLVLSHQVVASACVDGIGIAVQPADMTCSMPHATGDADQGCEADCILAGDASCDPTCESCTDYLLIGHETVFLPNDLVALPPPARVVIALLVWPDVSAGGGAGDHRVDGRAPASLVFLRTVVLRC